ncbi:hypothetical protein ABPG77_002615 [Micractinium sp. CCAP 211/92]
MATHCCDDATAVCDDGVPLPAERRKLDSCGLALAGAAGALAHPLIAGGSLLVQTTGLEEMVVRWCSLVLGCLPSQGSHWAGQLAFLDAGAAPKPPGSSLNGSVFEATLRLQEQGAEVASAPADGSSSSSSSARAYAKQLLCTGAGEAGSGATAADQRLLASADQAVACLQQLLGMLRVLAPPVHLLMRLTDVALQAPDGSFRLVSGSRRFDLQLDSQLGLKARFGHGGWCTCAALQQDGGLEHRGTPSRSGQQASEQAEGAALDGPAVAGAAGQLADSVQPLTYIGIGEAGWGCAGAGQAFRGCKWAARAGVVLRMPDHARLAAAAATQRGAAMPAGQAAAAEDAASAGCATQPADECVQGASSEPCGQQQASQGALTSQGNTPVFLFRSWGMQLRGQQAALKGVQKCEWQEFGFLLDHAEAGAEGPMAAALRCAQPASGATLTAAVVHLTPNDYRAAAEGKQPPGLAPGREAQLVRAALEGALSHLKQQCPAVVSSRRERSLERALPLIGDALAGILLRSEHSSARSGGGGAEDEGSALHAACSALGCPPEKLQERVSRLLWKVVRGALQGDSTGGDGEQEDSGKRARRQGGGGGGSQPAPE